MNTVCDVRRFPARIPTHQACPALSVRATLPVQAQSTSQVMASGDMRGDSSPAHSGSMALAPASVKGLATSRVADSPSRVDCGDRSRSPALQVIPIIPNAADEAAVGAAPSGWRH